MDSVSSSTPQALSNMEKVEDARLASAKHRWYHFLRSLPFLKAPKPSNAAQLQSLTDHLVLPTYDPRRPRKEETFLYLAYGSNLASDTFRGRRNIQPLSAANVVVPALRLVFDLPGLPYMEPCFANTRFRSPAYLNEFVASHDELISEKAALLAAPAPPGKGQSAPQLGWDKGLVGVVYEVTKSDYAHIIATEGGGTSYADIEIECFPLSKDTVVVPEKPAGESFQAHTLFAGESARKGFENRRDGWAQPSARYLGLLTTGAAEHELPMEYRNWLAQLHPFRTTTKRQEAGKVLFIANFLPVLLLLFSLQSVFAGNDGKAPAWLGILLDRFHKSIWFSYDYIYKRLFGEGERTIGDDHARVEKDMPLMVV